jgi:phage baseplate assembly protein W
MSNGISPKLPLRRDKADGYELNKTLIEAVEQNFKNLILTNPGERIMDIHFGAGIRKFLFEQNDTMHFGSIATAIRNQTDKYLPHITIEDIKITNHNYDWTESDGPKERSSMANPVHENEIQISILYSIPALGHTSIINVGI